MSQPRRDNRIGHSDSRRGATDLLHMLRVARSGYLAATREQLDLALEWSRTRVWKELGYSSLVDMLVGEGHTDRREALAWERAVRLVTVSRARPDDVVVRMQGWL